MEMSWHQKCYVEAGFISIFSLRGSFKGKEKLIFANYPFALNYTEVGGKREGGNVTRFTLFSTFGRSTSFPHLCFIILPWVGTDLHSTPCVSYGGFLINFGSSACALRLCTFLLIPSCYISPSTKYRTVGTECLLKNISPHKGRTGIKMLTGGKHHDVHRRVHFYMELEWPSFFKGC